MEDKIIELGKRIQWLEKLCQMAKVPKILIENTDFLNGEFTEEDMEWARKVIDELNKGDR